MINLYAILEVDHDARPESIKAAFRHLVHKYHPDRNPGRTEWAESKLKSLIEAYRILSNPDLKYLYDIKYRQTFPENNFDPYIERLRKQTDTASKIQLMMHLMYEGENPEGLEIYENLISCSIKFSHFMKIPEYLDLLFFVAEEKQRQKRFVSAFHDYIAAYTHGESAEVFGFFRDEILDRVLRIFFVDLKNESPEMLIEIADIVLEQPVNKRIRASVLKKKAEMLLVRNDCGAAREVLLKALSINPRMSCKKMKVRLDIFPG